MGTERGQRSYDHRLVQLVQESLDPAITTRLGVPRSTATGWVKRAPRPVVTATAAERAIARQQRLELNRAQRCAACA